MKASDIKRIKGNISKLLLANAGIAPGRVSTLLPTKGLQGKLYEAHVLATVCERLFTVENFDISLVNGTQLKLKQKGGPINRNYPYFEVKKAGRLVYELFTDTYFTTLSYQLNGRMSQPTYGDYHELDIVLLEKGCSGIPSYEKVRIAIECKNTSIKKSIIREMLGFRRELTYYSHGQNPTGFLSWPARNLHAEANPSTFFCSAHMLYCSDNRVTRYVQNCLRFGIIVEHHTL